MICLLVRSCESAKDQDVFVGDLIQATTFETDPVRVFFDLQVHGFPVLPTLDVILLNQVRSLTPVEASHYV